MNTSQTRAVEQACKFVERDLNKTAEYGDTITEWLVEEKDGYITVRAQREMTGLPLSNLLRALDRTWYLFFIGKRGAVELAMGPKSLKQFAGKKFLGVSIAKNY